MPELPEAETIVRGLRPILVGRRIERVRVHHTDLLADGPRRFARGVKGCLIAAVSRRGKAVVLELEPNSFLVVNLGMTGGLFPLRPGERNPSVTHPGVRFYLEGGGQLVYNDARRFGRIRHLGQSEWCAWSAALGPEPLTSSFTPAVLASLMSRSRSPVRSFLLDQRKVAGVGNIYAVEACHRAGVDPRRPANSLGQAEVGALHGALVRVLADAVRARGTTIRDYRDASGAGGGFGSGLQAYGREGQPCRRCSRPIERVVFSNRSAFLCPACQPSHEIDGLGGT